MSDEPYFLTFGEGYEQWSAPNPNAAPTSAQADAYDYLVRICPDTKTAVAKLRKIRAAYRKRINGGPVTP